MTCRLISGVGRMASMAVLLTALSTLGQGACSSAAMDGTWLYRVEGKMYKASGPNPAPNATTTDFAAVGIMRLNGGNGVATESASNAGELSERTFPVTYSVDADCRGRLSLTYCPDKCSGAVDVRNLTVASDSSEGYFLNAIPNTSIVGELRKAVAGNCGNSTITGAYRYITSGTGLNGSGHATSSNSSATFNSAGTIEFGGNVDDVIALGGLIIPRMFPAGIVTLRSDCTGEIGGGTLNPAKIYASADGKQFVVINWFPGTIVSGWNRKQ